MFRAWVGLGLRAQRWAPRELQAGEVPQGWGPGVISPVLYRGKLQAAGTAGKHQPDSCKKGPGEALLGVLSPWR